MFVTDIGEEILIEVEDSGQGVHDEIIRAYYIKVFRRSGQKRGYGLAKVKELVEDLNGSIAIEKGDLGGVLFIIALPKERGEL